MSHLSEEQLIELLYCKDSPVAAHHLGTCSDCARANDELRADLADLKSVHPPARDEDYGHQVWTSIADSLPTYARPRMKGLLQPLWLGLGALVACALLIASFYAGRIWEHRQPLPRSVLAHAPAPPATPRVVVVVLSDHLERSERLLVQLKHASADDSELALPLRDEARSLLAANRACQQEAEAAADPALTQALDHLNDVLTELADHPGSLNANAIAKLQHEMDTEGLLFEVRVLRSRIPDHQASIHPHHAGGIA
jgi:hypothetical protein